MFMMIVFIALMVLLIVSSGATLHLCIFKAHPGKTGFGKKALGGVLAYGVSTIIWLVLYSHHHLGW